MLTAFNCRETGVSPCNRYRAACTHKSDSAVEELNQHMGTNPGTVCNTQKNISPVAAVKSTNFDVNQPGIREHWPIKFCGTSVSNRLVSSHNPSKRPSTH